MNLKIEKGPYLVVNEWDYVEGKLLEAQQAWHESTAKKCVPSAKLYKGIDRDKLVLIYKIENFEELQSILESKEYNSFVQQVAPFMDSDFHQSIYGLADSVVSRENLVPSTKYIQLRSIEVPLSGIDPYLEWRKGTIFDYVKRNQKVNSFLAFHSLFSSNPGILFVAEIKGEPKEFRESFLTNEYREIIKEAGHDHIKGGLHTYEYELTENLVASY